MQGSLTWITRKICKTRSANPVFDASLNSDVGLSISLSQAAAVSSVCPCCSVGEYDSFDYATVLAYSKLAFRRTQNFEADSMMFLTPSDALIVCVLVNLGFLHTFRNDRFPKILDVQS